MKLVQCIEGKSYTKGDGTTFVAPCTGIFVDITAKEEKTPNLFGNVDNLYESIRRMHRDWVSYTPAGAIREADALNRRIYGSFTIDEAPPTGSSITNDLHTIQTTVNDIAYAVTYNAGAISSAEHFVSYSEPANPYTITLPQGATLNTEATNNLVHNNGTFNLDEES